MKHKYHIEGMMCNGCRSHVENELSKVAGVTHTQVNLEEKFAEIEMADHIPLDRFQKALAEDGGSYTIHEIGHAPEQLKTSKKKDEGPGTYYCPMQCEGDKTYDAAGDCPVCGMDLVKEVDTSGTVVQYTCPMHPEIIRDEPGSCPICGMDLVPLEPSRSEEEKTYQKLLRKFWIALAFTLPIFIIAMTEMIPGNPLYNWLDQQYWNWIQFVLSLPVVFYATWMFFERAYRSIKTWNLNC